jgi:hypothetical protein
MTSSVPLPGIAKHSGTSGCSGRRGGSQSSTGPAQIKRNELAEVVSVRDFGRGKTPVGSGLIGQHRRRAAHAGLIGHTVRGEHGCRDQVVIVKCVAERSASLV